MMKLTKTEVIANVANRWKSQYGARFDKPRHTDPSTTWGDVYQSILAANGEEELNAAIGNTSWTTVTCNECRKDVDEVAVFDVNMGEYALYLCKSCCMKAWENDQ